MNWNEYEKWVKHLGEWGAEYHKTLRARPVRVRASRLLRLLRHRRVRHRAFALLLEPLRRLRLNAKACLHLGDLVGELVAGVAQYR